jgi:hypothetical protein
MKQQNWSLALPELFPYSIPVCPCSFPVRSLLRIGSVPEEKPKNADGIDVLYALVGQSVGIFPVFFPANGNFRQRRVRDWHHRHTFNQLDRLRSVPRSNCKSRHFCSSGLHFVSHNITIHVHRCANVGMTLLCRADQIHASVHHKSYGADCCGGVRIVIVIQQ